jgi:hypothetical protein
MTLSTTMLNQYAEFHYAEFHYAEYHYAECHYAECHYAECHYAECHCAECHYAECRILLIVMLNALCRVSLCWMSWRLVNDLHLVKYHGDGRATESQVTKFLLTKSLCRNLSILLYILLFLWQKFSYFYTKLVGIQMLRIQSLGILTLLGNFNIDFLFSDLQFFNS